MAFKKNGDAKLISVRTGNKIKCACGKEVTASMDKKTASVNTCPDCGQNL